MRVTDPVCGMEFDAEKAVGQAEQQGKTCYYCSEARKRQCDADLERYPGPTDGL